MGKSKVEGKVEKSETVTCIKKKRASNNKTDARERWGQMMLHGKGGLMGKAGRLVIGVLYTEIWHPFDVARKRNMKPLCLLNKHYEYCIGIYYIVTSVLNFLFIFLAPTAIPSAKNTRLQ